MGNKMREIKFRFWEKSSAKMRTDFWVYADGIVFDSLGKLTDKDVVVMQYTGLKDKNGKEIYESDILRWKYEDDNGYRTQKGDKVIGHVWYNDNTTEYKVGEGDRLSEFNRQEIEIIGNTYENPNLIN